MTTVAIAAGRSWRQIYLNAPSVPYWGVHALAVVGVITTGWSWGGLALAVALYLPRMFFVTGAYHRYFAHRSYKTSRWFQFVLALGATSTAQKGVLWWAAHHRHHHKLSDQPGDLHSVQQQGFGWAHHGWILARELEDTDLGRIKDLARYRRAALDQPLLGRTADAAGMLTYLALGWFGLVWGFAVCQVIDVARHVHDQLALAPVGRPALRDDG